MKSLIAVIALVVSANSFANSLNDSSNAITFSPFLTSVTSAELQKAEAGKVIREAQEFIQTGEASVSLLAKISTIQGADDSISADDAVGLLIEDAQAVLSN